MKAIESIEANTTMSRVLCWCSLLLLVGLSPVDSSTSLGKYYVPSGLQSGPDPAGSSFASSVAYNPADNTVMVVGSTYGSYFGGAGVTATSGDDYAPDDDEIREDTTTDCFFAVVQLPPYNDNEVPSSRGVMKWTHSDLYYSPGTPEVCSVATWHGQRLLVGGTMAAGGFMDPLRKTGTLIDTVQYGMLLDMPYDLNKNPPLHFQGGTVLQYDAVVLPVALVTSAGSDYVYTVSMVTAETTENRAEHPVGQQHPQDPTKQLLYGQSYGMTVERILITSNPHDNSIAQNVLDQQQSQELSETLYADWRRPYHTTEGRTVHVAGIAKISDDLLIVAGSTAGTGEAFGVDPNKNVSSSSAVDGFITRLHPETGNLLQAPHHPDRHPSVRISSSEGNANDWITGICHADVWGKDPDHFYVVGNTEGRITPSASDNSRDSGSGYNDDVNTQAFVMKIDANYLRPVWTIQFGADAIGNDGDASVQVRANACTVTHDGEAIWVAGTIGMDAVLPMSGVSTSFGGTDVWAAKVDTRTGKKEIVRQLGTDQDDFLPTSADGGLTSDQAGNAILVVNTAGSLYRKREDSEKTTNAVASDIAVFTISRYNGAVADTATHSFGFQASNNLNGGTLSPPQSSHSFTTGLLIMIVAAAATALIVYKLLANNTNDLARSFGGDAQTERDKVLNYLSAFDVEEIDLRHSATGGWHCTYTGKLALGIESRKRYEDRLMLTNTEHSPSKLLEDDCYYDHFSNPDGDETSIVSNGEDPLCVRLTADGSNNSSDKLIEDSFFMGDDDDDDENAAENCQSLLYTDTDHGKYRDSNSRDIVLREQQESGSSYYGDLVNAYKETQDSTSSGINDCSDEVWGNEII